MLRLARAAVRPLGLATGLWLDSRVSCEAAAEGGAAAALPKAPRKGPEPCVVKSCAKKKDAFSSMLGGMGGMPTGKSQAGKGMSTQAADKAAVVCPPDVDEIGAGSWIMLHTMAAYYPDNPTAEEAAEMMQFIYTLSKFYPCEHCAYHMREWLPNHPPRTESRKAFSAWMCELHNEVNVRLGKPVFKCDQTDIRWRDGPLDGSCEEAFE
jgi:FAD-linked sulfhydryl oxidase